MRSTLFILLFCLILPAQSVFARSADMFEDKQWSWQRPSVPSDYARGQDMFKPIPVYTMGNPDVFANTRRTRHFWREDMFPRWKADHVPLTTLKMDPRSQVIENALRIYRSSP